MLKPTSPSLEVIKEYAAQAGKVAEARMTMWLLEQLYPELRITAEEPEVHTTLPATPTPAPVPQPEPAPKTKPTPAPKPQPAPSQSHPEKRFDEKLNGLSYEEVTTTLKPVIRQQNPQFPDVLEWLLRQKLSKTADGIWVKPSLNELPRELVAEIKRYQMGINFDVESAVVLFASLQLSVSNLDIKQQTKIISILTGVSSPEIAGARRRMRLKGDDYPKLNALVNAHYDPEKAWRRAKNFGRVKHLSSPATTEIALDPLASLIKMLQPYTEELISAKEACREGSPTDIKKALRAFSVTCQRNKLDERGKWAVSSDCGPLGRALLEKMTETIQRWGKMIINHNLPYPEEKDGSVATILSLGPKDIGFDAAHKYLRNCYNSSLLVEDK